MVMGALIAHFCSDLVPASHAAWAWTCTYYEGGDIQKPKTMKPDATDGPKCSDASTLQCTCPKSPCKNRAAAVPTNLACAGAGDDAATSGCFKLHHTYGTPHSGITVWSGRASGVLHNTGTPSDQISDACGAADVIKVYGHKKGLDSFVAMGGLTAGIIDSSEQPASAQACQTLCANHPDCKFFSFNDQGAGDEKYAVFRDMCFLHKALTCEGTAYSTYHGIIAGPKACPAGVTVPAPPTAKDSTICLNATHHKMPDGMVMLNSAHSKNPCTDCKAFPCEVKAKSGGGHGHGHGGKDHGGHDDHSGHDHGGKDDHSGHDHGDDDKASKTTVAPESASFTTRAALSHSTMAILLLLNLHCCAYLHKAQ